MNITHFPTGHHASAIAHSASGGIALHVPQLNPGTDGTGCRIRVGNGRGRYGAGTTQPMIIRDARGSGVGYLYDRNRVRLIYTAMRLGILDVKALGWGGARQRVELWGAALRRALDESKPAESVNPTTPTPLLHTTGRLEGANGPRMHVEIPAGLMEAIEESELPGDPRYPHDKPLPVAPIAVKSAPPRAKRVALGAVASAGLEVARRGGWVQGQLPFA